MILIVFFNFQMGLYIKDQSKMGNFMGMGNLLNLEITTMMETTKMDLNMEKEY
jgi:hypothetical protein